MGKILEKIKLFSDIATGDINIEEDKKQISRWCRACDQTGFITTARGVKKRCFVCNFDGSFE